MIGTLTVTLLDHSYTARGLRWGKLKGADADRAALLRAAADKADCEAVLALAEIKETWDTEARKITYLISSELTSAGGAARRSPCTSATPRSAPAPRPQR
ncbi:MAG TPA: hypothetical protein VGG16_02210 [Streptosporangiaceae bacterium]|jgi:hypothetical protein